jgi:type II secretory pathway component HofQ
MFSAGAAAGLDRVSQQPAQATPQPAPAAPKGAAPTARLQVVLSRFNGDKRVANQPYVLLTVANGQPKVLRIGAEVPIAGAAVGTKDSPSYKSIGTNIFAVVTLQDDGRYLVSVNVESSSPYPDDQKQAGRPAFRNYKLDGNTYLKDGQTAEVASATDSLTGEVIKMEVTLTTVK